MTHLSLPGHMPTAPLFEPHRLPAGSGAVYCYSVHGVADPGLLPRLIELFAKRGGVPLSMHVTRQSESDAAPELVVDLQVDGLALEVAAVIADAMRQIPVVSRIYMTERIGVPGDADGLLASVI